VWFCDKRCGRLKIKTINAKKNAPFLDDWKRTGNKILNLFVSFQFAKIKRKLCIHWLYVYTTTSIMNCV